MMNFIFTIIHYVLLITFLPIVFMTHMESTVNIENHPTKRVWFDLIFVNSLKVFQIYGPIVFISSTEDLITNFSPDILKDILIETVAMMLILYIVIGVLGFIIAVLTNIYGCPKFVKKYYGKDVKENNNEENNM